jgi:predicted unusual protein kinase regulating ubiquinone biosynthesis (AarF/ABC1/UbiB family)
VHAAKLRTGEDVVVKVPRPQIARLVREDIEAMLHSSPRILQSDWLIPRQGARA